MVVVVVVVVAVVVGWRDVLKLSFERSKVAIKIKQVRIRGDGGSKFWAL